MALGVGHGNVSHPFGREPCPVWCARDRPTEASNGLQIMTIRLPDLSMCARVDVIMFTCFERIITKMINRPNNKNILNYVDMDNVLVDAPFGIAKFVERQ